MSRKSLTLRTQLSMAMVFAAVLSVSVFITGMAIFYTSIQKHWVNSLNESNRETLLFLIDNKTVNADALTTLINIFSLQWSDQYSKMEVFALLGFVLLATLISTVIGIIVAKRLSLPIEVVRHAALRVSDGALDFQVDKKTGASTEADDLLNAFNEMTYSLKKSERESRETTAAIAHELRTPLTILQGRLQGLKDGVFEPSNDIFSALLGQVDTLSHIVNDLGTISRLNTGKFALELQQVNLADIVMQSCTSIAPDIRDEGLQIEMQLESAWATADTARVRQALNALLTNCRQYAKSGGIIYVKTRQLGNGAELKVIDEGPGMVAADHDRAFDRWWRADGSRSRIDGGSGLGLSVVQVIAEAHGGTARICNGKSQKGLIVTIFFPERLEK